MNVRDDRYVGPLADLVQRSSSIIVRHRDPNDLTAGLDHLLDLANGAVDVGRVGLRHRLHRHRRTAADLYVADLYCSGELSHTSALSTAFGRPLAGHCRLK